MWTEHYSRHPWKDLGTIKTRGSTQWEGWWLPQHREALHLVLNSRCWAGYSKGAGKHLGNLCLACVNRAILCFRGPNERLERGHPPILLPRVPRAAHMAVERRSSKGQKEKAKLSVSSQPSSLFSLKVFKDIFVFFLILPFPSKRILQFLWWR